MYEERPKTRSDKRANSKMKHERYLANGGHLVTSARPTYRSFYVRRSHNTGRPIVAVRRSLTRGFDVCEVYAEERTLRVRKNLTREALRAWLDRLPGVAELVYYEANVGANAGRLTESFLPFLRSYCSTVLRRRFAENLGGPGINML